MIEANDGTKGELAFSASAVEVDEESESEVTLTLNRNLGVFGRVSVYVYASTKAKGAVNGEDFNFTDRVSCCIKIRRQFRKIRENAQPSPRFDGSS